METRVEFLKSALPGGTSSMLSVVSALLLTLAFPDFELAPLAWFAIVPLLVAVSIERSSRSGTFLVGWISGTLFFFGTCWWLTFAPITYAGMAWWLAYLLLLLAASVAGAFFGIFALVLGAALRNLGDAALFAAIVILPATEFARYWVTGNNWNAVGYSQAFVPGIVRLSSVGGVYVISAAVVAWNTLIAFSVVRFLSRESSAKRYIAATVGGLTVVAGVVFVLTRAVPPAAPSEIGARITVVQPDVPMSGLTEEARKGLLSLHFRESMSALAEGRRLSPAEVPSLVVFPESPMNFQWGGDAELREIFAEFTRVSGSMLLFNSAEPAEDVRKFHNSAVLLDREGRQAARYDKIHLLPFGEFIPFPEPVASWMPAFVGNFERGEEYTVLSVGGLKAGVLICFESHFGSHAAGYVRRGADVIIEMTNDGYLGKTPVLRQHLANSVMRAAETRRTVVRATNVGVTALIDADGSVVDSSPVYTVAAKSWNVPRSDGSKTFYVRFGDWFAILCSLLTLGVLFVSLRRSRVARS